jgi:hypothetical protein
VNQLANSPTGQPAISPVIRFLILLLLIASAPLAAQVRYRAITIPTRDAKALAADLYSTDTTVARPTILVNTPYNKNLYRLGVNIPAEAGGRSFPWDTAHYNVVVADWRGYYGSRDAAVAGYDRGLDGYDAVEWIATQRWSNGRVGTWGPSALGLIQFQTAAHYPPHLVCAVPLVKDFKTKYTDYYYGGEYRREHVSTLASIGFVNPATILSRPTYDIVWTTVERNTDIADRIAVPMFLIGGWFDHYPDDVIRAFEDLRTTSDETVRAQHRLLMGPWLHSEVGALEQGALSYPNASRAPDSLTLAFFDHHLRGLDNGFDAQPIVQYYQMGDEEWRTASSWSAVTSTSDTLALCLGNDFELRREPAGSEFVHAFSSDPRSPSPTVGGSRFPQPGSGIALGPQDQRDAVESRSDVLMFETPVLTEDLAMTGAASVELFVRTSTPDADVAIRLTDVHPDGRSMLVTQGIQRLRFRNGLRPQDTAVMPPGSIERVRVQLPVSAMTWRAGHRLRIIVSGSNYPHFERNLNVGGPLYGAGDTVVATIELHGDRERQSRVLLPVPMSTSGAREEIETAVVMVGGALRYSLAKPARVAITVHDMLGREVARLVDGVRDAGEHEVGLDGETIARGSYVVRMTIDGRVTSMLYTR